ncbi:MAG TPA: chromate transporter [Bryobacteraceae bacterium]|nr:chromate transporter [Bryobacteraceae bacterium]
MSLTKTSSAANSPRPRLRQLASLIFQVGATTFASGAATIALIGSRLEARGWLGPAQFDLSFTLSRTAPGTNVFAFVAAASWFVRGWPGALVGVLALSIPSAVTVVLLTLAYEAWNNHPIGRVVIETILAAIVGVMFSGAWMLIRPRIQSLRTVIFVLGALIASRWLSPLTIMATAGVIGYLWPEEDRT